MSRPIAIPKVSVVIVNWNSKRHLRACLRALGEHAGLAHETIVVDGASYDGVDEMLGEEFPAVIFVQSEKNLGFGLSNNLGASQASGDYLLLLNPDTLVRAGAISALLRVLKEDPEAGAVGARLLNTDGSLQTSCVQSFPTPLNQGLDSNLLRRLLPRLRMWGTAEAFAATSPTYVEAVSGACILIHRALFEEIGGFDKRYFMYAEDMQLCLDVARAGKKVVFQPGAEIVHHGGGASGGEFSKFSFTEKLKAVGEFIRGHQGEAACSRYRALMRLSAFVRLAPLAAGRLFGSGSRRAGSSSSIRRWLTVLRWKLT